MYFCLFFRFTRYFPCCFYSLLASNIGDFPFVHFFCPSSDFLGEYFFTKIPVFPVQWIPWNRTGVISDVDRTPLDRSGAWSDPGPPRNTITGLLWHSGITVLAGVHLSLPNSWTGYLKWYPLDNPRIPLVLNIYSKCLVSYSCIHMEWLIEHYFFPGKHLSC